MLSIDSKVLMWLQIEGALTTEDGEKFSLTSEGSDMLISAFSDQKLRREFVRHWLWAAKQRPESISIMYCIAPSIAAEFLTNMPEGDMVELVRAAEHDEQAHSLLFMLVEEMANDSDAVADRIADLIVGLLLKSRDLKG